MKNLIVSLIFILAMICQNVLAQDSPASELEKARQLIMQGQKQEANAIFGSLMANEPDNKTAVRYWFMANMKRSPSGEMDAIVQLDSLQKLYPKNTGIMFFKYFIQAEYGKTEEALAGFTKLTEMQPDTAVNYIGKGQMLSVLNRYEEAAAAFEKALTLDTKRFDVWGMEAAVLAKLKKCDEALVAINKGIELNPGYPGNISTAPVFTV
jgi:predicted Zn-dependent protease